MRRFGKSGAGTDVYKHFGFDAVQIVREISEKLDII
jgi:transketolase